MTRPRALVPVSRMHVIGAVAVSAVTMILFAVADIVQHKFSLRDLIFLSVAFVVFAAGGVWVNWHGDNTLERQFRESRHRHRTKAPPKTR